jgi:TolB-like protein/Tfp pilus assembly protein PilF
MRNGFRVGPFEVEPLAGRISGPDGVKHVQPKVMEVFLLLAAHAGEVVERDTLLDQVWRRITSEEVLTRCISELRRALGDERGTPAYIETVPKRGYRLLAAVAARQPAQTGRLGEASVPARGDLAHAQPPAQSLPVASIAVLPFDNHSTDPAHQFLGDAFAAELHSTLARVDRLRVAARRSSFVFRGGPVSLREIGERLDVDYVISGTLSCGAGKLHVTAELNDARDDTQLWAQSYDRASDDLLMVEKEIAEAIVAAFATWQMRDEMDTARQRSTSSLDAWGLVQKARALVLDYTDAGLSAAIEPLERAIELDPDYPAAHATLSALLVERLVNGWSARPAADAANALEASAKALALAPQDPLILKLASLAYSYAGDHHKALNYLRKAVAHAPFDFGAWGYMGWPLTATGDHADIAELRAIIARLLSSQPRHPGAAFWLYHRSVADTCLGEFEAALAPAEAAVELRPRLALAWVHYANVLGQLDRAEPAHAAIQAAARINPSMTAAHYASLVQRTSASAAWTALRLGGLQRVGVWGG